jgi:ABC-2 type transport system permease protein
VATGEIAASRGESSRLRTLLALRGRLSWRQFSAERGRLVGLIVSLLILLPLTIGAGVASALGYLYLPEPWPAQLLAAVLTGLWLVWIILPLTTFSLNEGMDITRLLVYPIPRRELVAAMLLGTLFDAPTYIMLPLFLAIIAGWLTSPALLLLLPVFAVAFAQMIFSSQSAVTALGGILSSRRVRDVFLVIGAILGSSCYILQRALQSLLQRFVEPEQLLALRVLPTLRWTPPGSLAQAIVAADGGAWGEALLWLGYGLLWALLLGALWWRLTSRLVTGGGFLFQLGAGRARATKQPRARRAVRSWRWLPADLQELMRKELRLIWRTPQRRIGLLQGLIFPLIFVGMSALDSGPREELPPWLGLLLPAFAVFTAWIAGQNALGMEGNGLSTLFLTPVPRHRYWLAKGIVLTALSAAPALLLGLVWLLFRSSWQSIAGLLAIPGVTLATLAVTNLASIFFPFPVRTERQRVRGTRGGGCVAGLGNAILLPAAIGLAILPPAAVLLAAQLLAIPWLGLAGGAFATVYGVALFAAVGVVATGRLTLQREAELITATKLPEGD